MSFLGPFEALLPVAEPFLGSSKRYAPETSPFPMPARNSCPAPPPKPQGISTWEKTNSVKVNAVTFDWKRS